MKYSAYQLAIFDAVAKKLGNFIIRATAGSGKTTTAILAAQYMLGDILMLAFNKKISVELASRLSSMGLPNAAAATFHAIGLKAFTKAKFTRGFAKVDKSKVWFIAETYCQSDELKDAQNFITKLVGFAKNYGIGINGVCKIDDMEAWMEIVRTQDLPMEFDCDVSDAITVAIKVLEDSNRNYKTIDFDDMIYLPLFFNVAFPKFDWVIVDEAQDTNACRKLMLAKFNARLLIIGDSDQAIYGFTGAENNSMGLLKEMFNCEELPLSTCYRCAKNIVIEAQKYSSNIEAFENNPDGIVRSAKYDDFLVSAPEMGLTRKDGIVCRNNAPLVSLAFGLIRKGIGCRIEGRDIAANLIALCNKWKKTRDLNAFAEKLTAYFTKEFDKATNKAKMQLLEDKMETMVILIERCQSLGKNDVASLVALIDSMFSDSEHYQGPDVVVLSSIHKAKGLEFDRCFVLGMAQFQPSKYAITEDAKVQETNLMFVAVTRGKNELVHITDCPSRRKDDA
jgi:DNA helicase-2/ATP-dependent DNA helicase PcrA